MYVFSILVCLLFLWHVVGWFGQTKNVCVLGNLTLPIHFPGETLQFFFMFLKKTNTTNKEGLYCCHSISTF